MDQTRVKNGRPAEQGATRSLSSPLPTRSWWERPGQTVTGRWSWRSAGGGGPGQESSQAVGWPRTQADHPRRDRARERGSSGFSPRSIAAGCCQLIRLAGRAPGAVPGRTNPYRHPPRGPGPRLTNTPECRSRSCSSGVAEQAAAAIGAAAGNGMDGCWRSPRRPDHPSTASLSSAAACPIGCPLADPGWMLVGFHGQDPG